MTRASGRGLARFDRREQAVDALLAEAIDLEEVVAALVEAVEVAAVADEAALHEEVGDRFAEAVDVHGAAADEVLEQAEALRGALAVGAVVRGLALAVDDGRLADGAVLRHVEAARVLRAAAEDGADDLRDDVAGALDDDGIADADVLEVDDGLVVQRGELDGGAADAARVRGRRRG